MSTNSCVRSSFLRNAVAVSGVGDLDATAMDTPLCFSAARMPLACGYSDGWSLLDLHSLYTGATFQILI